MDINLSSATNKVLLGLLALISICFVSFVIWKEQEISKMQTQLQSSVVAMQQLQDNITRSQSQFATKSDVESLASANQVNLAAIEQNMNSINATLSGINVVNANSSAQNTNNVSSTSTTPIPPAPTTSTTPPQTSCPTDPFEYQSNIQNLALNEEFGTGTMNNTTVPIGQVSFDAAQKAPWSINIIPRQYSIVNVLGTSSDGAHSVYNKFSIVENGKSYPVNITNAQYEEEFPKASMSWWNPHLFFAADAEINLSNIPVKGEFVPSLNVGIMSYGKTTTNPDISILQVGVGYATVAHTPVLNINPINFNIGNALSTNFIDNTYLGPSFTIGLNGNMSVGAGLSVGFKVLNIITLSWQGKDHLISLKNSLMPALAGIDFVWHIKSNGCTDKTTEEVSTWGDKVNLITYKDNRQNFSEGCNYVFNAAAPADNDLILLLNNDIVIQDTKSISKMISLLKNDVGIVGSKLLYPDKKTIQHAGVVFTPKYGLPINYRARQSNDDKANKNRYFQAITGAVALMKAETYRAIHKNKDGSQGLDAQYIWSFEDIDMCLNASINLKKKVIYCGDTNITHEESASLKKNNLNKLFLNKNAQYFVDKWKYRYKIDINDYEQNADYNLV